MSEHPKGFFYQLNDDGSVNEKTKIHFDREFLNEDLTEQQLLYYATYELKYHYDLVTRWNVMKFYLRKPFYVVLIFRNKQFEYICQSIPASYLDQLRPTDFPFRLKKTLFVVLPKERAIKKTNDADKQIPLTDLNRLLNAIDANMQKEFKAFSPILYTGMTN